MTDTADTLNGNEVRRQSAAVPQRIKSSDSRAEKRGGFGRVEAFRNRSQSFHRGDHGFLIAAGETDTRNSQMAAVDKISSPPGDASAVLPSLPSLAATLAFFPTAPPPTTIPPLPTT